MLHLPIKRPGEQLGQPGPGDRDLDAIGSDFHPAEQWLRPEPLCESPSTASRIAPGDQHVEHFALGVDGAPQIEADRVWPSACGRPRRPRARHSQSDAQDPGSQDVMNEADGATTGRRIRISRPGDENARCKALRAPDRRKDFSQRMPQSKTPSTSNAISPRHERTGPFV
jgi:hypothetical protein